MGIGAGIFLIAIGAILTFAIHYTLSGVNLQTVGVILMIVGVIGLAVDLAVFAPRRRRVTTRDSYPQEPVAPVAGQRTTIDERY